MTSAAFVRSATVAVRAGTDAAAVGNAAAISPCDETALAVPDRFVVFDLETTGLDPESNEIIEIGAIRVDRITGEDASFQSLVRPIHPIPPHISTLTGITQAMVDDSARPLGGALSDFLAFIGDLPLVTFAADFDMAFLHNALRMAHPSRTIGNPVACALKMARRAWPFLPSYRLSDLARDAAAFTHAPHRALGDSERARLVYLAAARELIATRD